MFCFSTASAHAINLTGAASIAFYEQALSLVTYSNTAQEPTSGERVISFQVFDGRHHSNIANGVVSVELVDDNPLLLMCGRGLATFVESATTVTPISLTNSLTLMDADVDHTITGATVTIENAQLGDVIALDSTASPEINVASDGSSRIIVSGDATASQYEVSDRYMDLHSHCAVHIASYDMVSSSPSPRNSFEL